MFFLKKKQYIIIRGRFDPPGDHHLRLFKTLTEEYPKAELIIVPYRSDDIQIDIPQKAYLIELAFGDFCARRGFKIRYHDLRNHCITPIHELDGRCRGWRSDVWHYFGSNIIRSGVNQDIRKLKLIIGNRSNYELGEVSDLKKYKTLEFDESCSSTLIRQYIIEGKDFSPYVSFKVYNYIVANELYGFRKVVNYNTYF